MEKKITNKEIENAINKLNFRADSRRRLDGIFFEKMTIIKITLTFKK